MEKGAEVIINTQHGSTITTEEITMATIDTREDITTVTVMVVVVMIIQGTVMTTTLWRQGTLTEMVDMEGMEEETDIMVDMAAIMEAMEGMVVLEYLILTMHSHIIDFK